MSDIFGADDKPKRTRRTIPNEELPSGALPSTSPSEQSAPAVEPDDHVEQAERIGEEAGMVADHAHRNAEQARILREHLNRSAEEAYGISAPVGTDKIQKDRLQEVLVRFLPNYRRGPMRYEDLRPILQGLVDAL